MREMIRVYIASPYSTGDQEENVIRAMGVFDQLVKYGFAPYAPLLSHYQHKYYPLPYEKWLELDIEWLRTCHILLRLPGESEGADRECRAMDKMNKPVCYISSYEIEEVFANAIRKAAEPYVRFY